jgi:molybdate transport system substrate-binding protein
VTLPLFRTSLLTLALAMPSMAMAAEITVFAASSLKGALDAVAADWERTTGNKVAIAYDSSAKLARQISQGAPADLFISASPEWMDLLASEALIREDSRKNLLGNRLILIAADKDATPVNIIAGFDLAGLIGDGKLAMGLTSSVPAGQYGKEALTSLGIWQTVAPSVVEADSVRAALKLVATGEADYGIVFATDALGDEKVGTIGTFPEDSHRPILYPAAVVASSTAPEAQAFLDGLSSAAAGAIFAAQGFIVLK